MKKPTLTDEQMDQLIHSVEEALQKAESLSKSDDEKGEKEEPKPEKKIEKDEMPQEDEAESGAPDMAEAPPQEEAPSEDGGEAQAEPPMEGEQAPEDEMSPDQELAEDAPISDEELAQIYSELPPEEQQRHLMVLQSIMSPEGGEEAPAPAPAPEEEEAPMAPPAPDMGMCKSEKDVTIAALTKSINELKAQNEVFAKVLEAGFNKPTRKSIEGIEFMRKNENEGAGNENSAANLSKAELVSKLTDLTKGNTLSKSERDAITQFCLTGNGRAEMEKIINVGGKR